jgi:hypothetical protein
VITSQYQANDTISVSGQRNDPGIFSKVIAIPGPISRRRRPRASARRRQALHVAPMVVYCATRLIQNCNNEPHAAVQRPDDDGLRPDGRPGAFGIAEPRRRDGTIGSSTESAWISTASTST